MHSIRKGRSDESAKLRRSLYRLLCSCPSGMPCISGRQTRHRHLHRGRLQQLDSTPYGSREMRTPNMQRLADAGMTFTRACVASPSCAPSRAALLTGLMPARSGAEANHAKPRAELKKWPAYFQDLGCEVAAFGKVSHYKHTSDYGF